MKEIIILIFGFVGAVVLAFWKGRSAEKADNDAAENAEYIETRERMDNAQDNLDNSVDGARRWLHDYNKR